MNLGRLSRRLTAVAALGLISVLAAGPLFAEEGAPASGGAKAPVTQAPPPGKSVETPPGAKKGKARYYRRMPEPAPAKEPAMAPPPARARSGQFGGQPIRSKDAQE
jgi:hypothetical protein